MSPFFVFAGLFRWLIDFYIRKVICAQFCAFQKAGSDFSYTHVHFLRLNDQKAVGLGHDDNTTNDDEGHVVITGPGGSRNQAEDETSMDLRRFETSLTAYFHRGSPEWTCEEGYEGFLCSCPPSEGMVEHVWVCYTFDYRFFQQRYEALPYQHHVGMYKVPYTGVGADTSNFRLKLACGSAVVLLSVRNKIRLPTCDGFGGPADGENQLVKDARNSLQQAFNQIECEAGCAKSYEETFKGWRCVDSKTGDGLTAKAAVQWTVKCQRP